MPVFCPSWGKKIRVFSPVAKARKCPGLTPLDRTQIFQKLDRASLQSDPVAAATVSIKRVRHDSVKGWFMTKLLTPHLVSTGCGKLGKRPSLGNTCISR
jgi:hypothetical protein